LGQAAVPTSLSLSVSIPCPLPSIPPRTLSAVHGLKNLHRVVFPEIQPLFRSPRDGFTSGLPGGWIADFSLPFRFQPLQDKERCFPSAIEASSRVEFFEGLDSHVLCPPFPFFRFYFRARKLSQKGAPNSCFLSIPNYLSPI